MAADSRSDPRGRHADKPHRIPGRGWKDVLKRTRDEIRNDHLSVVAGGVAFFGLLGTIPALAALISIYGLVADSQQVEQQFNSLSSVVPGEVHQVLGAQMKAIASSASVAGWGAAVGLLLAIWGGTRAVKAVIEALNLIYSEEEKRGFLKLNITAFLLTLAAIVSIAIAVGLIAVLPAILGTLGLSKIAGWAVSISRWPLLLFLFMVGLSVLYRFGPSRNRPRWEWVSVGAIAATALWLGASALFSLYVSNFDSYNKTYGSLGTVVILLMWFYISGYVVLVGAELNCEIERQTARDTTDEPEKAMGQRRAVAADSLGEARS
jgi:membrane protein